jgi:hypothetical protein
MKINHSKIKGGFKTQYAIDRMMSSSSREMQATGIILVLLGFMILVSPVILNTISGVTGIKIESLGMIAVGGIILGIAFFVTGIMSKKKDG